MIDANASWSPWRARSSMSSAAASAIAVIDGYIRKGGRLGCSLRRWGLRRLQFGDCVTTVAREAGHRLTMGVYFGDVFRVDVACHPQHRARRSLLRLGIVGKIEFFGRSR